MGECALASTCSNALQLTTTSCVHSSCWIDVRDLAEAHVLAIQKPEAGGERIIVSQGPFKWQDFGKLYFLIPRDNDERRMTQLS